MVEKNRLVRDVVEVVTVVEVIMVVEVFRLRWLK